MTTLPLPGNYYYRYWYLVNMAMAMVMVMGWVLTFTMLLSIVYCIVLLLSPLFLFLLSHFYVCCLNLESLLLRAL